MVFFSLFTGRGEFHRAFGEAINAQEASLFNVCAGDCQSEGSPKDELAIGVEGLLSSGFTTFFGRFKILLLLFHCGTLIICACKQCINYNLHVNIHPCTRASTVPLIVPK